MQQQRKKQLTTQFFVIVVAIIILAIATDAIHAKSFDEASLLKIRTDCKQQSKPQLNDAEFKLLAEHKLLTAETTTATTPKSLQCYCLCYLNATGIYNKTGNIANEEYLREILPTKLVKETTAGQKNKLLEKCGKPTGADDCEKAFNFVNCMAKEAKIYLY